MLISFFNWFPTALFVGETDLFQDRPCVGQKSKNMIDTELIMVTVPRSDTSRSTDRRVKVLIVHDVKARTQKNSSQIKLLAFCRKQILRLSIDG